MCSLLFFFFLLLFFFNDTATTEIYTLSLHDALPISSSLFGLAIHSEDETAVKAMVDSLQYFQIGSSWGGYESLIAFNHMPVTRDRAPWTEKPFMLRVHIGLEDVEDLIADLTQGLARI